MTNSNLAGLCGRPTRKKKPCTLPVLTYWDFPNREGRPHSCHGHLTPQERAEYEREKAEAATERAEAEARFLAMKPACWSWALIDVEGWGPDLSEYTPYGEEVLAAVRKLHEDAEYRASALLNHWQASRCGICGRLTDLVTDHDHESGLVRGLLCHSCNTREGFHGPYPTGPFAYYRQRPPTAILGIRIRYWDPIAKGYAPDLRGLPKPDPWTDAASEDIGL